MEKKRYYHAVYKDKSGAFRVNGAVAESEEETIRLSKNHVSVKAGAKLHWIDSWEAWDE